MTSNIGDDVVILASFTAPQRHTTETTKRSWYVPRQPGGEDEVVFMGIPRVTIFKTEQTVQY